MSILDISRQEYVEGKVVDKYRLNNGNLDLIVEDAATHRRHQIQSLRATPTTQGRAPGMGRLKEA
jgi:hypothetical protein